MDSQTEIREEQTEFILKSACEVFAKFGFRKTTMEDIAQGTGLRKPSLYYYFKSKEEIFSAVVKKESRELLSVMEEAAAHEDTAQEKLRAFLFARYRFYKDHRNLYSVYQNNLDEMRPLISNARDEFVEQEIDALSNILEHGISVGEIEIEDPRLFSLVAIAALQGIDDTFWKCGLENQIEAGLHLILKILFRGLNKEQ